MPYSRELFQPDLFKPLARHRLETEGGAASARTYWAAVWRRLWQNRLVITGFVVIAGFILLAVAAPCLTGYTYSQQNLSLVNSPPSAAHWFGTDALGRDLFTRVWYGARISLAIGLVTSLICFLLGTVYGGISGYVGGWLDEIMMRLVDCLCAVPFLLYVILLLVLMGPGLQTIFIALGISYWLTMARIVRGQVLSLKEREYVLAAKALGAGPGRILFRHLLPNALGPALVVMTFTVPEAIFTEAFLSFLGLGVSVPLASWGCLINEGVNSLSRYPWQLFFPGVCLTAAIVAFNFVGNGLREVLEPHGNG